MTAQTEIRVLPDAQTALYDINNSGQSLFQRGYYDYSTGSITAGEDLVKATIALNDTGIIVGSLNFTTSEGDEITQAAFRKDGIWKEIGFFDGSTPANSWFGNANKVSPNGKLITGQISTDALVTYPFIYNVENGTLKKLDSEDDLWLYGRGEAINNDGYVVGFVDREDLTPQGTLWAPAYFDPAGNIHYIDIATPEDGEASDLNNAGLVVGYKGNKAFVYDIHTGEYKSFKSSANMPDPKFVAISENGLIIGFAGETGNRDVIVYHKNLLSPIYLRDYLASLNIDIPTVDGKLGTGMGISADGKFICGFDNQGPPVGLAQGWVIKLEDLPMGPGCLDNPKGMNPNTVFIPACTESPELITSTAKAGEYSNVQLTAGKEYIFSSSVATDFITLATADGNMVLKYGTGSVTFMPSVDQNVRFGLSLNENCGTSEENRSKFVICQTPVGCEWTVNVNDDLIGDEVSWYLKNTATDEILLSGGNYGENYSDTQTVFADGPLTFYIESFGDWGDNTPQFSVSNGTNVVVTGTLAGGEEATHTELNCAPLAVNQVTLKSFRYYPNPTTGIVNISSSASIITTSVYAIDGKQVSAPAKISDKTATVDLSQLTAGTYVVSVTSKNGTKDSFKIIKK